MSYFKANYMFFKYMFIHNFVQLSPLSDYKTFPSSYSFQVKTDKSVQEFSHLYPIYNSWQPLNYIWSVYSGHYISMKTHNMCDFHINGIYRSISI